MIGVGPGAERDSDEAGGEGENPAGVISVTLAATSASMIPSAKSTPRRKVKRGPDAGAGETGNVMQMALRPLYSVDSTFTLRASRSCAPESGNVCTCEAWACRPEHARVSARIISVAWKHFFRSLPQFGVMIFPFRPSIGSRPALTSPIEILSYACWGQF